MSHFKSTTTPKIEFQRANFIAAGTVGRVYAVNSESVIKRKPSLSDSRALKAYDVEIRVYNRLGAHPHIAEVREVMDKGLILERGDCLRRFIWSPEWSEVSLDSKLLWALEAAKGLQHIHQKGVVHADIGCHNMIVDQSNHVKYIDFSGSGIDGEPALVCYEWCSSLSNSEPCIQTDIFAFGSMIFEIESGKVPYHELQETLDIFQLGEEAERLFQAREYPDLNSLVLGEVVRHCWNGDYTSMGEVVGAIDVCVQGLGSTCARLSNLDGS